MSDEQRSRETPAGEWVPNSFGAQRLQARFPVGRGRGSSGAGAPGLAVAHSSAADGDVDAADGPVSEAGSSGEEGDDLEEFSPAFLRQMALARARTWDGDEEPADREDDAFEGQVDATSGHLHHLHHGLGDLNEEDDLALQMALLASVMPEQPPVLLGEDGDAPEAAGVEVPVQLQALLRSLGAAEAAHLAAMLGRAHEDSGVHVEEWDEEGEGEEDEAESLPEHLAELLRQDAAARDAERAAHRMESAARANLWAEQDRAYQESLAADANREAQAAAAAAAAAEAAAAADAVRQAQRDELQRIAAEQAEAMPREPAADDAAACELVVDIASPAAAPSRLRRRFKLEDPVSSVYAACRMAAAQAALDALPIDGAEHPVWISDALALVRPGGMRIVMGFPPFAPLQDDATTLAAAGVHKRERLIARAAAP